MSAFQITELDDRIEFGMAVIDDDVLGNSNGTCHNTGHCCNHCDGACTNDPAACACSS
jgi:hypothetical protein